MEPQGHERELLRLGWRLDALDEWRRHVVDPELGSLRREVNDMAKADEIAAQVAAQITKRRRRMFTTPERVVGLVVGICAVSSFVLQVVK